MIERTLLKKLEIWIDHKKALIIFGKGQTGKTTLAKASVTKSLWRIENIWAIRQSMIPRDLHI
ncbi:MAG: hypothetical protein ABIN24_06660 [Dyadobacter sp.]